MAIATAREPTQVIFVGRKPLSSYLATVVPLVVSPDVKEIKIVARGRGISRAVDLALIIMERWFKGKLKLKNVDIGTTILKNPEGRIDRVSEIVITLEKTG